MAAAAVTAMLAGLVGATGPAGAQADPGPGTPGGSSSAVPAPPAVTGTFRLLYVDPPPGSDRSFGPPLPLIETATDSVQLDQSQVPPGVEPGDTVRLAAPGGRLEVVRESDDPTAEGASGTHRLLLAMVSWSGHPADSMTPAQASSVLAANRTWCQTASAGRLDMPATVQNWLTIAAPTGSCTDPNWYSFSYSLRDNARAALTAQGYDLATYDSVVLYFADAGCPYGGLGGGGTVWTNGYLSQGLLVHELGHELGLGHAGILDCTNGEGGPAVPLSTTCVGHEYADYTDIMGGAGALFDGPHLDDLGWFGSGELAVVSRPTSGTTDLSRELVPLESPGTGLREVRIANADGSSYWLENRQRVGIDADVFSAGQAGMRLHFTPSPAAAIPCTGNISGCSDDSYLLNPAAGLPSDTGSLELEPGAAWTSPDDSVTVTARAGAGDRMTVDLQLAPSTGVAPVITSVIPGEDQAALTWTPGTGSLGAPATGYLLTADIRFSGGGGYSYTREFPSNETSAIFSDLSTGNMVSFRVAGTNSMGTGPESPATPEILIGPPRPDLRLKFGHSYWFDNVYNTSGAGQSYGVTGGAGTTFTHIVSVQNDGPLSEPLRIKASASSPGLILQYFSGGSDITAQVAAGTYRTRTPATGATQNIRIIARLTSSAPLNAWITRTITAISTIDTHRKDRMKLEYLRYL